MKVSKRIKKLLTYSFGGLYLAGTGYWLAHLFLRQKGEFGDEPHWLERALGPVHLIAGFFFIFILGIIWEKHIRASLKIKRHRFTGWSFLALMAVMTLSGIGIVYSGDEWGKFLQRYHPWIGVSLLPLLLVHVAKKVDI